MLENYYILVLMLGLALIYFYFFKKKHSVKYRYKGEGKLYELIKKDYKDSIYQYRDNFLDKQSYDIYIPSKKIAIEYQGEQHFKAIDYYGGKKSYKKQHSLDKDKIIKSKKQGITLLYFTFNKNMPNRLLGKKVYKEYKKLRKRIRYNWLYKLIGL